MFVAAFFMTAFQPAVLQNNQFCKAVWASSKSMYYTKTLVNQVFPEMLCCCSLQVSPEMLRSCWLC